MSLFVCVLTIIFISSVLGTTPKPTRPFSWETLPVFFHSGNQTGPWNDAAVKQIVRFPMATMEKDHNGRLPNNGTHSMSITCLIFT